MTMSTKQQRGRGIFDLLSGQTTGTFANILRFGLLALSHIYSITVQIRYGMYAWKILPTRKVDSPVISIGNIVTGGTGKSPMVELLGRRLLKEGHNVVSVSRGYKSISVFDKDNNVIEINDESMELEENLPELKQLWGAKRYSIIKEFVENSENNKVDGFIMDDGFQHIQLARDLDIVLIDSLIPLGFGHILPRGLLREPLGGLHRAQVIVLTRTDLVDQTALQALHEHISQLAPQAVLVHAVHEPYELDDIVSGNRKPVSILENRKVVLVSGIANPTSFENTVKKLGAHVIYHSKLNDHHVYTSEELHDIALIPDKLRAACVVMSQKDTAKIKRMFSVQSNLPIYGLKVRMKLTQGEDAFWEKIYSVIKTKR